MPVRYIEVTPRSELFVPATRAYGNIAIIGQTAAGATAPVGVPQTLTAPPPSTADPFGGPLSSAIVTAFDQTPGPTTVFAVPAAATDAGLDAAFGAVARLNAQIVVLAGTPLTQQNAATVGKLVTHVTTVSHTGGDGMERIGVAMLDRTDPNPGVVAGNFVNERMVYVAHHSAGDAAAAVAGVIAGYEPHISMLLKPVNLSMDTTFTDAQVDAFDANGINWLTDPVLLPGSGIYMGEGYTGNPGGGMKYIDIVRTLDDVTFQLKATLIRTIGNFRVSRSGLRGVVTLLQSVLSPLQTREVIEGYNIHIPLLVLLDKDPDSLSAAEIQEISDAHANRRVDLVVTVDYAGAIHRLRIDLVFK